jgi:hypothetical protein
MSVYPLSLMASGKYFLMSLESTAALAGPRGKCAGVQTVELRVGVPGSRAGGQLHMPGGSEFAWRFLHDLAQVEPICLWVVIGWRR